MTNSKDLIGNYSERVSKTVQAEVNGATYDANQIETEAVRIEDPGEGDAVVLRHFFFKAIPRPGPKPTKQEIFDEHKQQITTMLWGDGLRPREDLRLEVHTRNYLKKVSPSLYAMMGKNHTDFVVVVPCEAQKGVLLHEKPLRAL